MPTSNVVTADERIKKAGGTENLTFKRNTSRNRVIEDLRDSFRGLHNAHKDQEIRLAKMEAKLAKVEALQAIIAVHRLDASNLRHVMIEAGMTPPAAPIVEEDAE